MDEQLLRLHAICTLIRQHQFAGVDDSIARCYRCPQKFVDPHYGEGVQGCMLLAQDVYKAAHGDGFTKPPSSAGEKP